MTGMLTAAVPMPNTSIELVAPEELKSSPASHTYAYHECRRDLTGGKKTAIRSLSRYGLPSFHLRAREVAGQGGDRNGSGTRLPWK
jgi:hypothetical protein